MRFERVKMFGVSCYAAYVQGVFSFNGLSGLGLKVLGSGFGF